MDKKTLGIELKKSVLSKGYRFDYVAKIAGIGKNTLYRYMNSGDKYPIPDNILRLICLELGIEQKNLI